MTDSHQLPTESENVMALSDAEKLAHEIDRSEMIRTESLRTTRRVNELLGKAIHAISQGNLKVADEITGRALDLSMANVERLKSWETK